MYSRRNLIAAGCAFAVAGNYSSGADARELTGSIRIGYDGSNEVVAPFIEATVAQLRTDHPNAEFESEPMAAGNVAQLILQLSTGQGPDVFLLSAALIGDLASSGYVEPLDAWLESWDGWPEFRQTFRETIIWQDSVWAIPYPFDTHFLYYQRELFDQAGLPRDWQPTTPEDILAAASALKEVGDESIIPYALYAGANGGNGTVVRGFLPLVHAFGGTMKDENGKWVIDSCAIRSALRYYERAYQIDRTVPEFVLTGASPNRAMQDAMQSGALGILYEGCWVYGRWLADDAESTREQIGYALFPGNDGRPAFAIGGTGNSWYLNASSENKDLGWAFISAFNSRETQTAINLKDPHIPARSDAAADPAFQADPFLQAMVGTADLLLLAAPDPVFRQLIPIIQNATGLVASGEATPDEAMERYVSELSRVLGEDQVTAEVCDELR